VYNKEQKKKKKPVDFFFLFTSPGFTIHVSHYLPGVIIITCLVFLKIQKQKKALKLFLGVLLIFLKTAVNNVAC
jgi:hypothetical protein